MLPHYFWKNSLFSGGLHLLHTNIVVHKMVLAKKKNMETAVEKQSTDDHECFISFLLFLSYNVGIKLLP